MRRTGGDSETLTDLRIHVRECLTGFNSPGGRRSLLWCGALGEDCRPRRKCSLCWAAGHDVRSARRNENAPEHDVRRGCGRPQPAISKGKTRIYPKTLTTISELALVSGLSLSEVLKADALGKASLMPSRWAWTQKLCKNLRFRSAGLPPKAPLLIYLGSAAAARPADNHLASITLTNDLLQL